MKKIIFGVVLALLFSFFFKKCSDKRNDETVIKEHSALIAKQIKNVGKLVVTEGSFSEVFSYKKSKALFADLMIANKQAIVIVNADVTIAYDLSKIEYDIDEVNKVVIIKSIPEEEIKINPDFEYYDVQADFFNPFEANDYNEIKTTVNAQLAKKIEASSFKSNAENRLISELSKFYILTNSLGWTLQYNKTKIEDLESLESIKL